VQVAQHTSYALACISLSAPNFAKKNKKMHSHPLFSISSPNTCVDGDGLQLGYDKETERNEPLNLMITRRLRRKKFFPRSH
jgi:hypothetical protein